MIYNVFNEDLLTWCKELQYKSQHVELAPLSDIINKEEEYEVKEVRKHWKKGWKTQYLVHWKGYGNEYDQWIVEIVLSHTKETIEDYCVMATTRHKVQQLHNEQIS